MRIFGRDQQIYVPKNAPARLVEHKSPQTIILVDEKALLPNRVAGRRRYSADDHIADLTFRVATHHMYHFGCFHRLSPCWSFFFFSARDSRSTFRL